MNMTNKDYMDLIAEDKCHYKMMGAYMLCLLHFFFLNFKIHSHIFMVYIKHIWKTNP